MGKTRVRIGFAFAATITLLLMLDGDGTCALALAACILHECGHLAAMLTVGERPCAVHFSCCGMRIETDGVAGRFSREMWIILSGPFANLSAAALLRLLAASAGGENLQTAISVNLALGAFNMLPCLPLDAGRGLEAVLSLSMGAEGAHRTMEKVTALMLIPLFAGGVAVFIFCHYNFTLLAVAAYIGVLLISKKDSGSF